MRRLIVMAFVLFVPVGVFAQTPAPAPDAVDVRWVDVADRTGQGRRAPVFSVHPPAEFSPGPRRISNSDHTQLLARDDQFRRAKIAGDRDALSAVLSAQFSETTPDALGRSLPAAIASWTASPVRTIRRNGPPSTSPATSAHVPMRPFTHLIRD